MADRLIRGRYRINGLLSEGGVARICTAEDSLTGRSVIIKEPVGHDTSSRRAIINEYEFIRLHPHPGLIPAQSFIAEHDQVCMVMPLVNGVDLKSWFSGRLECTDEGLRDQTIEAVLSSILESTAFIHFCGHLYNDFKPDNFLVVESQASAGRRNVRPILLDFNLICNRGEHPTRRGTLAYISPEVLKGEAPSVASDLYSLGATIFELFSGHPPYIPADSGELIKLVTSGAPVDYSAVPAIYREALASLLSLHPENRPGGCREAASALGLGMTFDELLAEKQEYYLAAGAPPFADELIKALRDHLNGMTSKAFLVRGMSHNAGATNYMTSWLEVGGWEVNRIGACDSKHERSQVLDVLERRTGDDGRRKSILLVEDWERLSESEVEKLKTISRSDRNIPMVLGAKRWVNVSLPHHLFDPLMDKTINVATAESLKALLKRPRLEFRHEQLSEISGGDPELVYRFVLDMLPEKELNLIGDSRTDEIRVPGDRPAGVDRALKRMCSLLSSEEREVMDRLSVWGFMIPLLLLVDQDSNQCAIIDRLVESGFLIMEKDSVAFSSGAAAKLLYSQLSEEERLATHHYWAEAAERRLEDPIERLETTAVHWGLSDDIGRGFRVNFEAAVYFLRGGMLSRARSYAEMALELAQKGGGSVSSALSISADIARTQGDYADAREKYIGLLWLLRADGDDGLKAKSLRELGDIYRSLKKARKAITCTKRALRLYRRLADDQGVADCLNEIGLANWVVEKYSQALKSFESAAEIDKRLGNHRELAKIESNQGIIKDMMGETGGVKDHFLKALENARKAGDNRLEAMISNNLGFFLIRQGEFEDSKKRLQAALRLSEQIGYKEAAITSLTNLGLCHLRLGDLLDSVDFNQRARELAVSLGNKHLAADAELNLTEACILMGNYGLADTVLESIESSSLYVEDRTLKAQVDLLRSRWRSGLGDFAEAFDIAAGVSRAAEESANKRLKLEADIAAAEAIGISNPEVVLSRLMPVAEECQELGHSDLFVSAGLLMSELCLYSADQFNAESWIEKILSAPNLPAGGFIRASILSAEMLFGKGQIDAAVERLAEMESLAAGKGFVLLALRSAVVMGELLVECRKYRQADKTYKRARDYREKIISAWPENINTDSLLNEPLMARLSSGLAAIEEKSLLKI